MLESGQFNSCFTTNLKNRGEKTSRQLLFYILFSLKFFILFLPFVVNTRGEVMAPNIFLNTEGL